jgi:hypothetical protein
MSQDKYGFVLSNSNYNVAAAFKAQLAPSIHPKYCRLQEGRFASSPPSCKDVEASPLCSAPINTDFMQFMRTRMITAFINSQSDNKISECPLEAPPPSLDRILLFRARINSRKQDKRHAKSTEHVKTWHDPILVMTCSVSYLDFVKIP